MPAFPRASCAFVSSLAGCAWRKAWLRTGQRPVLAQLRGALGVVALTTLGAALRFATLDLQSFDFDEAFTVGPVLGGSFGDMLDAIPRTESTPPLYYTLAWL